MSIKQWVQFLTEDCLTMDGAGTFKPCRVELSSPGVDWTLSWRLCRLSGLGSELTSFNFKLLHQLLVSRVRLHQLTPAASPLCTRCSNTNEDLLHLFIDCECNNDVGKNLLNSIKNVIPNITGEALLRLEFANLPADLEFPITYFTSFVLMTIWEKKMSKSRIIPFDIRSTLEAKCILLRKTRNREHVPILEDLLRNL